MKKIATFLLLCFCIFVGKAQTTQTFISSGSFTVPAGVTSIFVEAWGSGGAGGGARGTTTGSFRAMGGGGGGGAYNSGVVIVTPGDVINYNVAPQTAASTTVAVNGLASNFLSISANGGLGGEAVTATTAHIGGLKGGFGIGQFNGGDGGSSFGFAGSTAGTSAGGGGGGGTTAAGGNGGNWSTTGGQLNGGAGGVADGGAGARGQGSSGNNGLAGTAPGGGGSGAYAAASTTQRSGGAGARGQIRITYPVTFITKSGATNWSSASSWSSGVVPPLDATVRIDHDIVLDVVATVGSLNLNGGKVSLGANNLTTNTTIGGSGSSYVITNGTGSFKINNVGSTTTLFPIGPDASTYMPATIANTGTVDNYAINVVQSLPACLSGAPASNSVNAAWDIAEEVAGGSNVALTLDYATSTTGGGYLSGSAKIVHCTGSSVDYSNGSVTGTVASGSGFTSFSPFGITSDVSLLPVKLQSFTTTLNNNTANVNWKVGTETNIASYEIERSNNGTNFTSIGNVLAQNLVNYSFTDNTPLQGTIYYRLKINEQNGGFHYSLIAKVKINGKALNITTMYPSPAKEFIKVSVQYTSNQKGVIEIIGLNGKTIASQEVLFTNGSIEKTFNVSNLLSGVYVLRATINNETVSQKFIKQ